MIAAGRTRGQRQRLAADQYREKAAEALVLAGAATLERVRERHEHAAETWRKLAVLNEKAKLAQHLPIPIPERT